MKLKKLLLDQNNLFVLLVIIAAVFVGFSAAAYSEIETSAQNNSYETSINVTSADGPNASVGIDAGSGMSFGRAVEGSNITKSLELNSRDLTFVESSVTGNISDNLYYDEKVLFRNETEIDYKYAGIETGYFEGEIMLDIKTADNYWGEKWLELYYFLPF